jgi:hypothetical protein
VRRRDGARGGRAAELRRGYEPVRAGPLANAGMQEEFIKLAFAIAREGGMGQFF